MIPVEPDAELDKAAEIDPLAFDELEDIWDDLRQIEEEEENNRSKEAANEKEAGSVEVCILIDVS